MHTHTHRQRVLEPCSIASYLLCPQGPVRQALSEVGTILKARIVGWKVLEMAQLGRYLHHLVKWLYRSAITAQLLYVPSLNLVRITH